MKYTSLQSQIKRIADKTPKKVAIEYQDKYVTYSQLYQNANFIANSLNEKAIENKIIPVFIDKKPLLIEVILGILKFGGTFVPLDTSLPENRLGIILRETQADWIFSEIHYLDKLNQIMQNVNKKINVIIESSCSEIISDYPCLNVHIINGQKRKDLYDEIDIFSEDCYIYFTSGSTGKPKGVLGRHKSLKHFIDWEMAQFGVNEDFRVSQLITPSFDPFLRDIFVPLCSGATLCIPENREIILNPKKLANWIDSKRITLIHMVPTLFKGMIKELEDSQHFDSLKYILLAGELLKGNDLKKFYELFGSRIQLVNLYGPTETTLAKTFYLISENDVSKINVPIGKPINDTEILILGSDMKSCTEGNTGEIYIHTNFKSSGYFNDTELTKKVFLKNPFSLDPKDLIYKTGDLGKVLADGNIECLGRIDNQVKVRGIRIELSEIETYILKDELVKEAVVIAKDDDDGDKYICAFLVADEKPDISRLRECLSRELPDYMVPSHFAQIDKMPLLPNGKIDRKTLEKFEIEMDTGVEYQAPRNEIEEKLTALWQEVLRIKRVGVNDNFFFLGGHSLKAANLAAKLFKEFNVEIPVKEIFKNNTIKALAKYIENSEKSAYAAIPLVEEKEYYLVSSAQKRIYLVSLIDEAGTSYNMPEALLIEGNPDRETIERAFKLIVGRHEALRTSFELTGDGPVQRIHNNLEFKMDFIEVNNWSGEEKDIDTTVKGLINDFIRPFDLSQAPLFRVCLVKLAEDKYVLLRDMHHIISDGISEEILKAEFAKLYNGIELEALKLQYKDFSQWQNKRLMSEAVRKQEEYWLDLFSGELPVLNMPIDYPRPPRQSFEGDSFRVEISKELTKKINRVAVENGASLYMVLMAALNVLLSKYTGQEDIVIGSPVAGRGHANLDSIIGVFINTLAMRNNPSGNKTFKDFLENVRDSSFQAFENQDCQFEYLIEKLDIERDLSRNPLFDVMFILQNMNFEKVNMGNLKTMLFKVDRNVSKFDLTLTAVEGEDKIELCFEYCSKLFRKETIERLGKHYANILKQAVQNTGVKLSDIDMLLEEERKQILFYFNDTYTEYPSDKTIHRLFEEQAERTPDKTALAFGGKKLTYSELNIKANQLAEKLREKGVKADGIVGLMVTRSMEMFIGLFGILKAGGAYLPIDPEYPAERVQYMLENSECGTVLTNRGVRKTEASTEFIHLDDESLYSGCSSNLDSASKPDNLAYVIYTSGSTGKPKGVMIEHRNVSNFIKGMTDKIDFSPNKTILCLTTISFDIFVLESLVPLANGLTVVIADEKQQMDPDLLSDVIAANGVDMLQCTPSRMQMLLKSKKSAQCLQNIKELIIGGEAFPEILLQDLSFLENTKIYNVYGPTETTVWSTIKELTDSKTINIGKPIANTQIYILDRYNSLQPVGVAGELHVAGDGLARGYFNREDLTTERFIANPFVDGKFMYKTGDLARWLPNGEIEYIGRMDNQVKVRGYRIELPEIEKCIIEYGGIKNCVCVVKEDDYGVKYLAAYYVSEQDIPVSEMRTYLAKYLPDYMVPQTYMCLEQIPMTPNGKVDRNALPSPDRNRPQLKTDYVEARTVTEKNIAEVWKNVLKRDSIGINDSFFDLGGNSLLLVVMHNSLEKLYHDKVAIADIFANPTISKLAQFINREEVNFNDIDITGLNLPHEYFLESDEPNEDIVLEYEVEGAFYEGLKMTAKEFNINLTDIMLAVYMYLLSEVTGQGKVAVQEVINDSNAVQLDTDLSDITDFSSLFGAVSREWLVKARENTYDVKALSRTKSIKGNSPAVVAFTCNSKITLQALKDCDFMLKVVDNNYNINLIFEYAASRIRSTKAEEFLQWYIKLISLMNKKINC
ncbi:MAG: amino acid adenylation domain-containing protein [Clostridia bacterium]|nr:amino acid adenylation domain-containing protein [Clostridia bacterium]